MRTLTSTRVTRNPSTRRHSIIMMSVTTTGPDRSIWTTEDETRLVQFLLDHHAEAGDGANFKMSLWNAAGEELSKHVTKGGLKTGTACKGKWERVCIHYFLLICTNHDTS